MEAEFFVESDGRLHPRQSVEPHDAIVELTSEVDHVNRQLSSDAMPAERRADVEALHLTDVAFEFAKGNATGEFDSVLCQKQRALWRRVLAGKGSEFLREILETEIDADVRGVLLEEPAGFVNERRGACVEDRHCEMRMAGFGTRASGKTRRRLAHIL